MNYENALDESVENEPRTLQLWSNPRTHAAASVHQAKILIVDDEPELVSALAIRLKGEGYKVLSAGDGAVATRICINECPDVVIMDIGMPCGNGHEVARRLKNNIQTMLIPIIYLTARTDVDSRSTAVANGGFAYMTKPFDGGALLELVKRALANG